MSDPRVATEADMPGCAAVVNRWIDNTPWFARVVSSDEVRDKMKMAPMIRKIWVIGHPVEAYLSLDADSGHIGAIYCDNPGRGHGKALMDMAKTTRDFLSLNTHLRNERAQAFYRREGFKAIREQDPEPPETLRELRMEWTR